MRMCEHAGQRSCGGVSFVDADIAECRSEKIGGRGESAKCKHVAPLHATFVAGVSLRQSDCVTVGCALNTGKKSLRNAPVTCNAKGLHVSQPLPLRAPTEEEG